MISYLAWPTTFLTHRTAELGEGLEDVFGAKYWEDEEAKPFSDYFNKIQSYELALRDGNPGGIAKPTPPPFPGGDETAGGDNSMETDRLSHLYSSLMLRCKPRPSA
ncbi:hypothetical protein B0H14DRAFT_3424238 [Mycena olivaceomarginata]|nr:hypothetical protein B0H14DRAFT_3424238 [Mycena olivaceomarginata]